MKVILSPLFGTADDCDNAAIGSALVVAKHFESHVKCLHVKTDPRSAVAFVGEGMTSAMIESVIEMTEKDVEQKFAGAVKLFKDHCTEANVPVIEDISSSAPDGHSAELIVRSGNREDLTIDLGRMVDMIVMSKVPGDNKVNNELLLSAMLRETGRPVMVLNDVLADNFYDSVVIAWNGSVESSRAISYSLPFLRKARKVTLISVCEDREDKMPADDALNYLAWHGIHAKLMVIGGGSGKTSAQNIMNHAAECDAGLLVMGAYTRSKLRRLIFGAVTAEILENCAIPVIMAH